MKKVKIVIGSSYGDESKGLMTHHFVKTTENPLVIFHNGSAQRGHTVDYNPDFRHVYHHFGCGTAEGAPTFFADTFWIHPMEFYREWQELAAAGITPICYCDPNARIVTPFDMLVDHATEAYITWDHQEPEHGSCGYGTWCATDRENNSVIRVKDLLNSTYSKYCEIMKDVWYSCLAILVERKVDLDRIPEYNKYFTLERYERTVEHFRSDLNFFYSHIVPIDFDTLYKMNYNLIFESAQGLGLDKDCGKEWHTTSSTGLTNPYNMLKDKEDFNAEVCYVSRAYLTRHGIGDLEEETNKSSINAEMEDKTNVPNEFQGSLRYGYIDFAEREKRIVKDFSTVYLDNRFFRTDAITHCNEFPEVKANEYDYASFNPYSVLKG